jgi:hypothetical protein
MDKTFQRKIKIKKFKKGIDKPICLWYHIMRYPKTAGYGNG